MSSWVKDWPVWVLVAAFFSFVIYAFIKSHRGGTPDA